MPMRSVLLAREYQFSTLHEPSAEISEVSTA
jgi:hypothetical protein